jgi:hypothetical protein
VGPGKFRVNDLRFRISDSGSCLADVALDQASLGSRVCGLGRDQVMDATRDQASLGSRVWGLGRDQVMDATRDQVSSPLPQ